MDSEFGDEDWWKGWWWCLREGKKKFKKIFFYKDNLRNRWDKYESKGWWDNLGGTLGDLKVLFIFKYKSI